MKTPKFETFLYSITVNQIKDIINNYNSNYVSNESNNEMLKGFSGLKKQELIDFVQKSISKKAKDEIFKNMEPEFMKKIVSNALSLIAGEHKTEKIQNTGVCNGGKGYILWIKGKYGENKATVKLDNNSKDFERKCNCKIGKIKGICLHQMAIYLMLLSKKVIKIADLPFKISKSQYNMAIKRLELLASQSLFKEEPAILLEEDYSIYINGNLVTLEWGGDFAGKTTKDITKEKNVVDVETWVSKKVVDLILRKIKVKTKEGKPVKILIDSYGVIPKIMKNPKLTKKILKKFASLEDPNLPDNEKNLEIYLNSSIKENIEEISMEPPFEAYMGNKSYIFVSYTHKDKSEVYPILKKLNNEGYNIWYDEGIPLTTEWINTIAERLEGCKIFLSFISPYVMESDNTQDEIHLAINEKKTFLAIYLRETELSAGLKMRIRRIQGILKYEMKEEIFFKKLIGEIGILLE